jgi:hypothetical protein
VPHFVHNILYFYVFRLVSFQLIAATGGIVTPAFVEQFFPYSLVRHNFVALATLQMQAEKSAATQAFDDEKA